MALFADRRDAGIRLGAALRDRLGVGSRGRDRLVVGLPRGGVVVAAEVAQALNCPLDVLVVRKLGHPERPELGLGALAETRERVFNRALVHRLQVPADVLDTVVAVEWIEARRRVARYRGHRPPAPASGREVIVVDDGLATGFTALAAVESLRRRHAGRVVVAVPVGSPDTVAMLATHADDVVCLAGPAGLNAVGEAYDDFDETTDAEVMAALARAGGARAGDQG
jgi:putative phosphoribosyl transferase